MDNRNHMLYYLVLFLISPVLAVIAAMANFQHKNARLTLLLFMGAFGYTIIIPVAADGSRQAMNFAEFYHYLDFTQLWNILGEIISLKGGKHLGAGADELYLPILSFTFHDLLPTRTGCFWLRG
ncbi:hypothetical protein [Rhodohalobacter sp.]|uniref:hypothetical protein n=1 Tax=Rhodohalobacter sp. TaxID=1974210 RepID=UPI002ACD6B64|nr:hypothetical protein [Rhodohalobacter sp.]MDZ7755186.1 hypothetical protein [Rhodohalobacter sp.]